MRRAITIVFVLVATSLGVITTSVSSGGAAGPTRSEPLMPGIVREILVANASGVPLDAAAVTLNVTVAGPYSDGYLTVFPCGEPVPTASNLNFRAFEVAVPNAVIVRIGAGGKICLVSSAITSVIVDVAGYVPAGSPLALLAAPRRLLDTREGIGAPAGRSGPGVLVLDVAGRNGIAADARAAVLNVTVVDPAGPGFATVFPCDQPRPEASNVNFVAGDVRPNLVLAGLDPQGRVCIFTTQPTHLVVDATASASSGPGLRLVANPERVLDTRSGLGAPTGAVGGDQFVAVQITGRAGVPTGATSVVLNVTATGSMGAGFVTAYPCGHRPTASNLNHAAAQTIANLVVGQLDDAGRICLYTNVGAHLVADLAGWFDGTSVHQVRAPKRLYDSRDVVDFPLVSFPVPPAPGPAPTLAPEPVTVPPWWFPTIPTSTTSTTTTTNVPFAPVDTDATCDLLVYPVRSGAIEIRDLLTGESFIGRDPWFVEGMKPIVTRDCSGLLIVGYVRPERNFSGVRLYDFDGRVLEFGGVMPSPPTPRTVLTELIDGRVLASSNGTTWDVSNGDVFFEPDGTEFVEMAGTAYVETSGITPDGSVVLLGAADGRSHDIFAFDTASGELVRRTTLPAYGDRPALSPDATLVAVGMLHIVGPEPPVRSTPTIRRLDGTLIGTYPLGEVSAGTLTMRWVSDEQVLVCAYQQPPRIWTVDGEIFDLGVPWAYECPTLG